MATESGEVFRRRDSWDQEEYTEAEVTAGWVALEQLETEDDTGLRAMKSAIGAQDWTPRLNFSNPGRSAAATGGLWALGSLTGGSSGKNQDHGRR